MPEVYEVEVVTNEAAVATVVPASSLELQVNLESVSVTGAIPNVEVVEVTMLGTVQTPNGSVVYNYGNAPGLLVLNVGDAVPGGTPSGTVILRK